MAVWWATNRGPVTLVDCDKQDTGSATWWLDRCDDELSDLSWVKTTTRSLLGRLDAIGDAVVIDTPPRLDDPSLHRFAELADLVVIPGSLSEFPSVLQTFETVRTSARSTPVVCVVTRTLTAKLNGMTAEEVMDVLRAQGLGIAGALRQNSALADAVATGRRPDQLTGDSKRRIEDDLRTLMLSIGNVLIGANSQ